jgi:hypothetical protein
MSLYLKRRNDPKHIEVIELADGVWVSITKKLNKAAAIPTNFVRSISCEVIVLIIVFIFLC